MIFKCLSIASFGRGRLLWVAFLFMFCLFSGKASSQNNSNILDTLITINFNNQRLKDALEQMEIQTHITFSYKSGLLNENRKVNRYFVKERLEKIVEFLVNDETLSFNSVGRQIYFYIPRNTKFVPINKEVVKTVEVPVYRDVIIRDTIEILKRDTVVIVNTQYDTIRDIDTMFIERKFPIKRIFSYSAFVSQNSVAPGYKLKDESYRSIFDDMLDAESNGSATRFGIQGTMHYGNYSVTSGLGLSVMRNKANYDFSSILTDLAKVIDHDVTEVLNIFKADSFSIVLENPDTTFWIYDLDTAVTYNVKNIYKKDTVDFKYSGTNRFTYLTIPVSFGWEFPVSKEGTILLNAGMLVDFLISTKGKTLSDSPFKELLPISNLPLSPVNASFSLGAGYAHKLENKWWVYGKINYDFQVNSSYSKVYPVRKKPRTLGLTVGLMWR